MDETRMPEMQANFRRRFGAWVEGILGLAAFFGLLISPAIGQTTNVATAGSTPPGIAPGVPAGSYPLSDFDNVNLYNGKLRFQLPLVNVGGRGDAKMSVILPIEMPWKVTNYTPSECASALPGGPARRFHTLTTRTSIGGDSVPNMGLEHCRDANLGSWDSVARAFWLDRTSIQRSPG